MLSPGYLVFFVRDPIESAVFYAQLFDLEPVKVVPTFALIAFPNQMRLGLWAREHAVPEVSGTGSTSELCFETDDVVGLYENWKGRGIPIAQEPVPMSGMTATFVALDPDGHRIRIFCHEEEGNV